MVALCLLPPPGLALAAAFDLDANRKISRSAGQAQAPRTHPQGESSRCSAEDKRTNGSGGGGGARWPTPASSRLDVVSTWLPVRSVVKMIGVRSQDGRLSAV